MTRKETEIFIHQENDFPENKKGRPVYIYCQNNKVKLYPEPDDDYEIIVRLRENK